MFRIKCICEYDGTNYNGFQRQTDKTGIQNTIEKAINKVTNENITIHASGRTDRKVHALHQVFHFDTMLDLKKEINWLNALNTYLPNDIIINEVTFVNSDFHSRKSAISKTYKYQINTGSKSVFLHNYYGNYSVMNVSKLIDGADYFVGEHDFFSFSKYIPDKNTIRTITNIIVDVNSEIVTLSITGTGFLTYMVRYIVGFLIDYSNDLYTKDQLIYYLNNKELNKKYKPAEPQGLYLINVTYKEE